MLIVRDLHVAVENTSILSHISLQFEKSKNYCLVGKNGSGKSSLAMAIMGHPSYQISSGELKIIEGEKEIDLLPLTPDERSKLGIFVTFQSIPDIKGVKLFEFLRSIYNASTDQVLSFVQFKRHILPLLDSLKIDSEFLWRDVNVGFSGGERRKIEMLQLKLLNPQYIFLDEVDSGLDVDAFRDVVHMIQSLMTENNTFIIITHYFDILDYLSVDKVYLLESGKLVKEGSMELARSIQKKGFNEEIKK